jgi:hypothetical protein
MHVVGHAVRQGSLLVAVDLVSVAVGAEDEDSAATTARCQQQLEEVTSAQWLQWLGLPEESDMTVQVRENASSRHVGWKQSRTKDGLLCLSNT